MRDRRRRVRVRMVKAKGADAVELISGEMLSSRSRVNPLPSPGAREVELHDRTGLGARTIDPCRRGSADTE